MSRPNLENRRALVTGASGCLGSHFARVLHAAGAKVAVTGRRGDRLEALATELGAGAFPCILDVADQRSVESAFAQVTDRFGAPPDIIVNNSGIAGDARPLLEADDDAFAQVIDVNLTGAMRVARHAAQRLIGNAQGGSIINIASILGIRVAGSVAAYAASKAALVQLTRSMALEWARHDIRVNALAPGYVLTDINRGFFETDAGKALIRRIPQRRIGKPEDLDGPLLLLATDASRHMTGTTLVVDGGHVCSGL